MVPVGFHHGIEAFKNLRIKVELGITERAVQVIIDRELIANVSQNVEGLGDFLAGSQGDGKDTVSIVLEDIRVARGNFKLGTGSQKELVLHIPNQGIFQTGVQVQQTRFAIVFEVESSNPLLVSEEGQPIGQGQAGLKGIDLERSTSKGVGTRNCGIDKQVVGNSALENRLQAFLIRNQFYDGK